MRIWKFPITYEYAIKRSVARSGHSTDVETVIGCREMFHRHILTVDEESYMAHTRTLSTHTQYVCNKHMIKMLLHSKIATITSAVRLTNRKSCTCQTTLCNWEFSNFHKWTTQFCIWLICWQFVSAKRLSINRKSDLSSVYSTAESQSLFTFSFHSSPRIQRMSRINFRDQQNTECNYVEWYASKAIKCWLIDSDRSNERTNCFVNKEQTIQYSYYYRCLKIRIGKILEYFRWIDSSSGSQIIYLFPLFVSSATASNSLKV